jgi:hypothetical protein
MIQLITINTLPIRGISIRHWQLEIIWTDPERGGVKHFLESIQILFHTFLSKLHIYQKSGRRPARLVGRLPAITLVCSDVRWHRLA